MDTSNYINSGILEAYLLDLVTEEERADVERIAAIYPDVHSALTDAGKIISDHFNQLAVPPPTNTLDLLQARLEVTEIQKQPKNGNTFREPEPEMKKSEYLEIEVDTTHIRVHKYWRPAFIGVFILGKIFLAIALYYYFKSDSLQQEIERLRNTPQQTIQK